MDRQEKRSQTEWQQAEFLWRNGESYQDAPNLPASHPFLPSATGPWVELSNRYPYSLSVIDVFADASPASFSGEFQIDGTSAWIELDTKIEQDGSLRALVPYVPSQWLDRSRRLALRFEIDGVTHQAGEILLREIDLSAFNFDIFFEQTIAAIDRMAAESSIDLDPVVASLRSQTPANDPLAHLFGTARFSAEFNRDVLARLKTSGDSGPAVHQINEELLYLLIPANDRAELARFATGGAPERLRPFSSDPQTLDSGPSLFFGCAPIDDAIDLALESQLRCELENKKDIIEQLTEFTGVDKVETYLDKLGEKVEGIGEKASKKFISTPDKGSKVTSSLPVFAIKSSYELYKFREEWQKQQLPQFVEKFDYEVSQEEIKDRGYLLEDAKPPALECEIATLKVFAHVRAKGFDTTKFLRDKIPSASEALPSSVTDVPLFGDIASEFVDQGQAAALDVAEAFVRDDINIAPCRWPSDPSQKGIELRSQEQFRLSTVAGSAIRKTGDNEQSPFFSAAQVGKGPLRVELLTGESGNELCLEPFTGLFSYEVKPIQIKFNPTGYVVDDVDVPLSLLVSIEDSHDTRKVEWKFRDNGGAYLNALLEDDDNPTLALPHETSSGDEFHTLQINPPDDPDLYPLTVEAVSLAEGCLRGPAAPERRATALIHYQAKAFEIQPNRTCLAPNSTTTLTAIPADPSNNLVVEWEVVSGDATIEKTSDTTASLTVGEDPEAEIEIKATGNDLFEAYAYFSTGPCFEQVGLVGNFPADFLASPQIGQSYDNTNISAQLTFGASGSLNLVPAIPTDNPGAYNPGIEQVYALGALRATVDAVETIDADKGLIAIDASYQGMFYTLFNFNRPGIADPIHQETLGGTYFDGLELEEGEFYDGPIYPTHLEFSDDGFSVLATFERDIAPPGGDGSLSATWTVLNGSKVSESVEDETSRLVASFDIFEDSPQVQVIVSGTVNDGQGPKSYSVQGLTQHRTIFLVGEKRFKAIPDPDEVVLCGGWIGTPSPISFILDDCCGFINLSNSSEPEYEGIARQNTASAGLIDVDGELQSFVSLSFKTDDSLPYCSEIKRIKEEFPDPEPYDPEIPDEPDPDGDDTPEELANDFKGSPQPNTNTSFPSPDPSDIQAGSGKSGGIQITDTSFQYPYQSFLNNDGIKLATFSNTTGAIIATETAVSQTAIDFLGGTARIVSVGSLSAVTENGYFIERDDPDSDERIYDFWEIDPVDGLLVAKTLATADSSEFDAVGLGDFDGDGSVDIAGTNNQVAFGPLLIRAGSGSGFATPTTFFANPDSEIMRSATVYAATGQVFLATHGTQDNLLRIHHLDTGGNVLGTHVIAGLDTNDTQLKAFADLDGDDIPDAILHSPGLTEFTVIYLDANGEERSRKQFDIPMLSVLPGLLI